METDQEVSNEALRRIDSARVRDVAFRIKTLAPSLSDDDAECLAMALLDLSDRGQKPTHDVVRKALIDADRSAHAADKILKAVSI